MPEAVAEDDREDLEPETDDGAAVNVLTHGDPLRSLLELPTRLVDEAKGRFSEDGLHIRAVDPANVGLVDITAHATGFERYQFDNDGERVVGLNLERFQRAAAWARKRQNDPIGIDVLTSPDRMRVDITRPDQEMKRISEWHAIDPDSIRKEPDIPDLDLPCRATPSVEGFYEAVTALNDDGEIYHAATVTRDGSTLVLRAHGSDTVDDAFFFPNTAWHIDEGDEEPSSVFSLDYLADMATGLKKSKADRLTLSFGQQFPMMLAFEHEEWGFEGQFMLAPRIYSDGGD